ncbi:ABC transporter permease [Desulfitobacterium hafniense]|uniref:ABC transporter permease n=1 Tax=Desulfitobacterium hafniense TaxID=49338 RepID=UPI00037F981B|nr:ABC transporter permease [Desulfitobacterium hafniense]
MMAASILFYAFTTTSFAILVATLSYVFFSFVIASLSRTENNVSLLTNLVTMPLLLSSSAFYSLNNAPAFIQAINRWNPFQWLIDGLRSAFDLAWADYFANMGLISLAAIAALVLALKTFRYAEV